MDSDKKLHIFGILLVAFGLIVFLSLISYNPQDLSIVTSHPNINPQNFVSFFGAYISFFFLFLFGNAAYLVPILCFFWAGNFFFIKKFFKTYITLISFIVLFMSFSTFFSLISVGTQIMHFEKGGIIGLIFSNILSQYFGYAGSMIIVVTLILISALLSTEMLIAPFILSIVKFILKSIKNISGFFITIFKKIFSVFKFKKEKKHKSKYIQKPVRIKMDKPKVNPDLNNVKVETQPKSKFLFSKKEVKVSSNLKDNKKVAKPQNETYKNKTSDFSGYHFPPTSLLADLKSDSKKDMSGHIERNIDILEETLDDFGIDAKVVNVEHGPVVTLYELEPAPGVKIQKISNLSDDIALVMKAHDVRVVAPIPGKGTVGVEIPNIETSLVSLREIVESEVFRSSESKLTLALGKDVSGNSTVADLSEMPHLLIAGATGAGKTVCVNSIITSILFNATPDEVKFIMVDPKMVELVCFNDIPHLITPIVTEHKKVPVVLSWIVDEMERRYKILAKMGVRDIARYNSRVDSENKSDNTEFKKIPYLVLIIDELADLMSIASKEIEEAITRLAQLSRAVGIHMILATQRPSVDVITGTIKANFPARISFKVASKVDSRTVLDANGADKLLGKGDMLFLKPRTSKLIRAQGCLVSDKEVEDVVNFIKKQKSPNYEQEIFQEQEKYLSGRDLGEDILYDESVKIVMETGQASASMLQRRLRIGYTRAARLIDMMEENGLVGPHRGSKARKILVDTDNNN